MTPFYFGEGSSRLFGAFHPATAEGSEGVVLCYPGPQESMRVHWLYRQLANLLGRAGFSVLRFDYRGTGDSAGQGGTLEGWVADIGTAVRQLQGMTGQSVCHLVGARLGASLAVQAAASRKTPPIGRLVLWDPVVRGADYLDELTRRHRRFTLASRAPLERSEDPRRPELLGHPMPESLQAELRCLDLLEEGQGGADGAGRHLIATADRPEYRALAERWRQRGALASMAQVAEGCDWESVKDLESALLCRGVIQRIFQSLQEGL